MINIEKVLDLLEKNNYYAVKLFVNEMYPADIALLIDELDTKNSVVVFRLLQKDLAADAFAYFDNDKQIALIEAINDSELYDVFSHMFLDDTVDIIEEMPARVVRRILNNTSPDKRKKINEILRYPESSVGSIMTVEYVSFKKDITVAEAIAKLRKEGTTKETLYTCYVTENRKLLGYIDVNVLLTSADDTKIEDIMETNVVSIPTTEDKEEATRQINKYDLIALPVVDHEDRLVGIVTVDDAIDVLQSEVTEDISRMAAMEPIEDSYFKTPVFVHAKKRILWLIFLMFSATVTGVILQHFENAISVLPVLVGSIPMLMGTGGNSGSQSATIITRGIALGEVSFKDIFKVIFKEFRVSIIVSFALSLINIIRILAMYKIGILGDIGGHSVFIIAAVISFALLLVIIIAKFIGCTLPLLADKVGLDPALMASPIISTIVDACAVVIYFNIATAWLGI